MRLFNRYTVAQAVKDSFDTEPGGRFDKRLHGLLVHRYNYIREMSLIHEGWLGVLKFLYDCGQISTPERHKFTLLSNVLGFSARVDRINTSSGATKGSNLEPIHLGQDKPDANAYLNGGLQRHELLTPSLDIRFSRQSSAADRHSIHRRKPCVDSVNQTA